METFSSRIARYREQNDLSQPAMGKLLGITGKYVGMIERGEKDVDPESTLAKLLTIYEAHAHKADSVPNGPRSVLKTARLRKGFSAAEVAKEVGYSISTYQEIEEGRSQMGEKMARKVAKFLGIEPELLLDGSDDLVERDGIVGTFGAQPNITMGPGLEGSKAKYVPLLSMAQCGTMHAYDDTAYRHDGFLAIDPKDSKAFAVTLAGDSMIPRFEPGDVAVIYPQKPPRNGCPVLAKLTEKEGGDVMVKIYQKSGNNVTLISINPVYPPMNFATDAFQFIYPVASVMKFM